MPLAGAIAGIRRPSAALRESFRAIRPPKPASGCRLAAARPMRALGFRSRLRQRLDEPIGLGIENLLVVIHAKVVGLPLVNFRKRGLAIHLHPAHRANVPRPASPQKRSWTS